MGMFLVRATFGQSRGFFSIPRLFPNQVEIFQFFIWIRLFSGFWENTTFSWARMVFVSPGKWIDNCKKQHIHLESNPQPLISPTCMLPQRHLVLWTIPKFNQVYSIEIQKLLKISKDFYPLQKNWSLEKDESWKSYKNKCSDMHVLWWRMVRVQAWHYYDWGSILFHVLFFSDSLCKGQWGKFPISGSD